MSGGRNFRRISWSEGLKYGLRTTWELGKVIFPVTLIVTILQYTAVYDVLLSAIEPAMSWFGLPSGAAVPLLLGSLLNLYAAIGAIVAIELTVKEVFILAVMLSFSHMLPVEGAVCRRIGVSVTLVTFVRVSMALLAGMALNLAWAGVAPPRITRWRLPREPSLPVEQKRSQEPCNPPEQAYSNWR